jgi:hypothetical protein
VNRGTLQRYNEAMDITLNELEQIINHWRALRPSTGEERALSTEVNALANQYALMIFNRLKTAPLTSLEPSCHQLLLAWREQQTAAGSATGSAAG